MSIYKEDWQLEAEHEARVAERIYQLTHQGRFHARTQNKEELLAIEADWQKAMAEKPAEIKTIRHEIARARTYKPSFKQLCKIVNLAKRTYFKDGGLQSRTLDNLMLILLEEGKDEAIWIDLNTLDPSNRDFIAACQQSEGREIPLGLIINYLQANNQPLIYDETTWADIKTHDFNDDMPEPLRLALQARAMAEENFKLFKIELDDNVFLSQNCIPQIPTEVLINAGIHRPISETQSYQPTPNQPTA
jgi:ribosomal protein L29